MKVEPMPRAIIVMDDRLANIEEMGAPIVSATSLQRSKNK
jgi:hypothetical protein